MTKKSQNRLNRDAQRNAENEGIWDQLRQIYSMNVQALAANAMLCRQFEERKDIMAHVVDLPRFARNNNSLANDLVRLSKDLNIIFDKHKNRSGANFNPDDVMKGIAISEDYTAWAQTFNTCCMRTIAQLTEQWDEAQKIFFAKNPENTDPNVITDVEVKVVAAPAVAEPLQLSSQTPEPEAAGTSPAIQAAVQESLGLPTTTTLS